MSVFNYGDTKFNNPEQTAIADLVLTKNVETFNLRHGYRAQTHLGSMMMYHSILEAARSNKNSELKTYLQKLIQVAQMEVLEYLFLVQYLVEQVLLRFLSYLRLYQKLLR